MSHKAVASEIHLSPKERKALRSCPNCSGGVFKTVLAEREASKKHPMANFQKGRPVIQCVGCGFWTDLFGDQLTWRSQEVLRK